MSGSGVGTSVAGLPSEQKQRPGIRTGKAVNNPFADRKQGPRGLGTRYGEQDIVKPESEGYLRAGLHGRAQVADQAKKRSHLSKDLAPASTEYELKPNCPRAKTLSGTVQGYTRRTYDQGSHCPWQAQHLPERAPKPTKKTVSVPDKPEPRKAKGAGLSPSWPGNQAAGGPVPERDTVDQRGNANPHLMPKKQHTERRRSTYGRSGVDDSNCQRVGRRQFAPEECSVDVRPPPSGNPPEPKSPSRPAGKSCSTTYRQTSLMGGPEDGHHQVRGRSVSPERGRFEEPFACTRTYHRSHSADGYGSSNRCRAQVPEPYNSGMAPFDRSYHDGRHNYPVHPDGQDRRPVQYQRGNSHDPGRTRQFRPTCRVFSQDNTQARIWGE